jgi:hypothetical protein
MAFVRLNRVKTTVSGTPGTGPITLSAAVAAYVTPDVAGAEDGDTFRALIEDGASWQIGTYLYSSTGPTITLQDFEASSSGSQISFGSSAFVSAIVSNQDFDGRAAAVYEEHVADGSSTLVLDETPDGRNSVLLFAGTGLQTSWTLSGKTVTWTGIPPTSGTAVVAYHLRSTIQTSGVASKVVVHDPAGVGPYAWPEGLTPITDADIQVFVGGLYFEPYNYTWDEDGLTLVAPGAIGDDDDVAIRVTAAVGIGVPSPETIKTSHYTDRVRCLDLLDRIIGSRGIAMSTTALNGFATGFKGATDAANGVTTSTNSDVDATNGRMNPTVVADTYATVNDPTLAGDSGALSNFSIRQVITAAQLGANNGDRLRVTLRASSASGNAVIAAVYIGHKGVSAPNFDGTQVQMLTGGVAGATILQGSSAVWEAAYAFDKTKDLVIAIEYTSGSARYATSSSTGWTRYYKTPATGEADDTTVSGYSSDSVAAFGVDLIEVRTAIGPPNDQTIELDAQTVDSTGYVYGVVPVQTIDALGTLGTNLVVEYKIGAGSWENCTLTNMGAVKIGTQSLTLLQFEKDGLTPGTSVQVRVRTLNNKDLRLWGAAYDTVA